MDRFKVQLAGEKATLLITLYAKALDCRSPNSVLHDELAARTVERIDYDFDVFKLSGDQAHAIALRASILDDWVRAFLAAHPGAAVLNLACGLDSRVHRIAPSEDVAWFDVDYPEVMELRAKLMPLRQHAQMLAASVTDPHWLREIPADRPTIVVAEGLSPYLTRNDGIDLLQRLIAHLPTGEIVLDVYSALGLRLIQSSALLRVSGAKLHWAIEDPRELEGLVPGLHLETVASTFDASRATRYSWRTRSILFLWNLFPPLRRIGRLVRYRF